jgi:hypothetical protein
MGRKTLLIVTAVAEGGTGLVLLSLPSLGFSLLLGVGHASPEAILVGRIAGAALLAIGIASGAASRASGAAAQAGLLAALLVYNVAVATLLGYTGASSGRAGIALWPAVVFHAGVAAWCVASLVRCRRGPAPPRGDRRGA